MADISKLRFDGTDYNVKDASAPARPLGDGYSKTGTLPISSTDTISEAIGKLENNIGSGGGQTIKQDGVTGATVNRFGTCLTSASTSAKTVSITTGTFTLEAGARVTVKFSNANTAGTPTLNVNSTGAKNIYSKGSKITTGDNKALLAGTVDFIYDGTQYHLIGNYIEGSSAVTGVKGSNESSYRTGNVSLSYSNVGAAASSHSHSDYVKQAYYTSNKTSGSLNDLSEGRVYCSSNCTNLPVSANMMVETLVDYNGSYKTQRAEVISGSYAGHVFSRYYNGSWSSWIDLTLNTPITLATSGNISSASIDLANILTGTYLFTVTNNESGTNKYGCSLYVLQKFDSGTVYVMKPVSETTYAKLSSYSFSGNTMSLSFDKSGYKTLRLICLYR